MGYYLNGYVLYCAFVLYYADVQRMMGAYMLRNVRTTRHGSFILSNDRVRSIHNAASTISVTLMSHGGLLPRVSIVTNGVYEFQFAL